MSIGSLRLGIDDIVVATGGELVRRGATTSVGVTTDSRRIVPEILFIGLRGESFDGSAFAAQAAAQGAAAVVVERSHVASVLDGSSNASVIAVDSGVRALGLLAGWHRARMPARVVALTGSNGKTTTKEMLAAILRQQGSTLATEGNLNNEIGAPLTLLNLTLDHRFAVVELGMNHEGEIARLASFVRPEVGVVTNVAAVHVEHFAEGIAGISHAKGELFHALSLAGVAVANADDPWVMARALAAGRRTITFGRDEHADVRLVEVLSHDGRGLRVGVEVQGRPAQWQLPVVGLHNALNACAAAAAALALGLSADQIAGGLATARPPGRRLRLSPIGATGATLLDDCYNANPASTLAALQTLEELAPQPHRIAVLGDMRELGCQEEAGHREVGRRAAEAGLKRLVAFGPASRFVADEAMACGLAPDRVLVTDDPAKAAEAVRASLSANDVVLVKASRGTRLERVSELLAPTVEAR